MTASRPAAPKPFTQRQIEDVLDRVFAKGGDATVAFLLRIANDRAEKAKAQQTTPERKVAA
jgi:hypothetical protein